MKNKIKMKTIAQIKNKIAKIEKTDSNLFKNISNSILQFNKDLDAIISFQENKNKSLKNLSRFNHLKKLQIGGGSRFLSGYLNLDIFEPADILWDVRSKMPFSNNRFDEIFCEHFFEHLEFPKFSLVFKRSF